ncbi:MAG: RNA polymerase sigma factor [Syntrophomonadaceae bacterium]|nr:RNA polymerase sigma factor [Syntrophomonadaceae bacterium]
MANKPEFGDDSLWHLAIQNYYPRIVNYVFFLTEDRYLAEDIAQETFAKGIAKFHQLKDPDKFFPWLLSIAINTGRTQIERNKRSIPASDTELYISKLPVDESPAELFERQETATLVLKAIRELSHQEQQVTIMRYYLDMKEKDIAFALGVTTGTVKKQLFRARSKLYNDLHQLSESVGD